ncbi:formylglycine-generating enzyme family protein [Pilimelia columellifera]|uniref:SUMF1/EgtB/PvdO family nonheme iron enzyme n=1 Tax=Pilimelia columellifera subsp. columellifera TaxID=706583 RepID=A0ABN3N354_9ACTN
MIDPSAPLVEDPSPHLAEHAAPAQPAAFAVPPGALPDTDVDRLAATVEDARVPLAARLAAGQILAVRGDPRLTDPPPVCPVPGGPVTMGLAPGGVAAVVAAWRHVGVEPAWIAKETPAHTVRLAPYWIASYPVTNGEYARFLHDTGRSRRPSTWQLGAYPWDRSNHPVAGVEPQDGDAYADWLTARTGHPWRLPTEAEWEHAAAGPDRREHPWGDAFDPAAANTRETGVHTTTPVGAFPAGRSWCGAMDMGGNVEEFVADTYRPYPGAEAVSDDLTDAVGTYRVARGGSFCRYGDLTRASRRHGPYPSPLYPIGFRLATSHDPGQRP